MEGCRVYFRLKAVFPVAFTKNFPLTYAREEEEKTKMKGRVVDLSSEGLGFLTTQKLEKDDKIFIWLRLPGDILGMQLMADVRHQSAEAAVSAQQAPLYRTGVRFIDLDQPSRIKIARFIVRNMRFCAMRRFSLFVSLLLGLLTLGRVLMLLMAEKTLSGAPVSVQAAAGFSVPILVYIAVNVWHAFGIMFAGVGIFFFRATTRRAMVFLCAFGAVAQSLRLIFKTPLHFQGVDYQVIWVLELMIFVLFAGLYTLAHRQPFKDAFDTFIRDYDEHMARQRAYMSAQLKKQYGWNDPIIKN